MRLNPSGKRSAIGVDIGSHSIKAAQLMGGRLSAVVDFPRTRPGEALGADDLHRLRGVLARTGFEGKAVVLAAPPGELMTSILELPPRAAGLPFEQITRLEFSRVNKCQPDEIELSSWDLPEAARAAKGTQVMVVGYPHKAAERMLDLVESVGLSVVGIDTAPAALSRAVAGMCKTEPVGILDIGYSNTRLTLLQNQTVTYERSVPDAALKHLVVALKNRFELAEEEIEHLLRNGGLGEPDERRGSKEFAAVGSTIISHFEAFLQELQMAFAYTEQNYPASPVKNMLLVGGGANIPGLARHFGEQLDINARSVQPADVVESAGELLQIPSAAMMVAVGLSQWDVGNS